MAFLLVGGMLYAGKDMVSAKTPDTTSGDYSSWYAGVGLVLANCQLYCPLGACRYEDDTYGMMAKVGYDFNQYFGVEARALRTFWGKGKNGGERIEHFGIYAKPMIPFSDRFLLYGLLGYGRTSTVNKGGNGLLPVIRRWGFAWGIGLEYDLSEKKEDYIPETGYDRTFDGYGDQNKGWALFVDFHQLWKKHDFVNSSLPQNPKGKVDSSVLSVGVVYYF